MGSWLQFVVANVGEWLGSKKTKHALAAALPLLVSGYTGVVPWEQVAWGVAGAFGLGGLGQAIADVGKEAAKVRKAS